MGTWGAGVFENDDALDFVWEVEEGGVDALRDAFDQIIDAAGRPEAWAETCAVAGAAIVAAAFDGKSDLLPEDALPMLQTLNPVIAADPDISDRARRALRQVLSGDSELLELWRASGESNEAIAAITEVATRLEG